MKQAAPGDLQPDVSESDVSELSPELGQHRQGAVRRHVLQLELLQAPGRNVGLIYTAFLYTLPRIIWIKRELGNLCSMWALHTVFSYKRCRCIPYYRTIVAYSKVRMQNYSRFHKTLPKSSLQMHQISVVFDAMDDITNYHILFQWSNKISKLYFCKLFNLYTRFILDHFQLH